MKIKIYVSTNKVGSRCEDEFEIDDSELEGLSDEERSNHIEEVCQEAMWNYVDWGWEEIE